MNDNELNALLQLTFAPWDSSSWDNLLESKPEAALALEEAVAGGLTVAQVRDYADRYGYPASAKNWITQAILHLQRQREQQAMERESAIRATVLARDAPSRPSLAIHDAEPGVAAKGRGFFLTGRPAHATAAVHRVFVGSDMEPRTFVGPVDVHPADDADDAQLDE